MSSIAATVRHRYCIKISLAHGKHDQNYNFIAYSHYTYTAGQTKKVVVKFKKKSKY